MTETRTGPPPSRGDSAAPADEAAYRNLRWTALHTDHAALAVRRGAAAAYRRDVGRWAALAVDDQGAWDDLRHLTDRVEVERDGQWGGRRRDAGPRVPDGWVLDDRHEYLLMVADGTGDGSGGGGVAADHAARGAVRVLADDDLAQVALLAEACGATMFPRAAFALGTFHGLFDHGRLVSLAGTRGSTPRAREVVAVATVPDRQGEGLARAVVGAAVEAIRADGRTPYLQVAPDNAPAVRVYERLGFRVHRHTTVDVLHRAPGQAGA